MTGVPSRFTIFLGCLWLTLAYHPGYQADATETPAPPVQVLISVPDQRLAVVCDGELVARYPVSTSRFGTGDSFYSYRTPLGDLRVCDKIGEDLPPGAVIHHRAATGEVLPVNAPGRDPIVTRVIWLDGLQPQNRNARTRGIYIHGTPQEWTIGKPMSWGCIRMRSKDVIKVFDEIPVGTVVSIIPDKLPHLRRYEPPKEQPAPPAPAQTPPAPAAPSPVPSKPGPQPAMQKPAEIFPHEIPHDDSHDLHKAPHEAPRQMSTPLPSLFGDPPRENTAELRAMRGSILLANLPGAEQEKARGKAAPAAQ